MRPGAERRGRQGPRPPGWAPDTLSPYRPPLPCCRVTQRPETPATRLQFASKNQSLLSVRTGSRVWVGRAGVGPAAEPTSDPAAGLVPPELGGEWAAAEGVAGGWRPGQLTVALSLLLAWCRSGVQVGGCQGPAPTHCHMTWLSQPKRTLRRGPALTVLRAGQATSCPPPRDSATPLPRLGKASLGRPRLLTLPLGACPLPPSLSLPSAIATVQWGPRHGLSYAASGCPPLRLGPRLLPFLKREDDEICSPPRPPVP